MKVLVSGDRNWTNQELIFDVLDLTHAIVGITLVIEGEARGADKIARKWAESRGVSFEPHPAQWKIYGRGAGPIRNRVMRDRRPDLVLGFHPDLSNSTGTKDMLDISVEAKIRTIHITDTGELTVMYGN